MNPAFLELKNLSKNFGGLKAVDDVSLQVPEGCTYGLIGPNGAGKTTLFNVISGLHQPSSGEAILEGKRLTGLPQHRVALRGVSRTFQNLQTFGSMSVLDNVLVGAHRQGRRGLVSAMFRLPGQQAEQRSLRALALEALEFVGLAQYQSEAAANLPPGQQRLVEIARALALKPRLLLLDEPAAGLTTRETETLGELIERIANTGLTTMLIEHDMSLVMSVCAQVAVLEQGRLLAVGTASQIQSDPRVVAAYLGGDE